MRHGNLLDTFSTVEIMFEFSKAIRHGVIALESLNELDGVDRQKVNALAQSVRHAHEQATVYIASLLRDNATDEAASCPICENRAT